LAEDEAIHRRTGIPIVYVTHNTAEAVGIGTHIVILNQGQVVRQGSPQEMMPWDAID
jgi:ABC-type proline/glycine betaine transport system ATPase subunit